MTDFDFTSDIRIPSILLHNITFLSVRVCLSVDLVEGGMDDGLASLNGSAFRKIVLRF